jgi:hypothetical protein
MTLGYQSGSLRDDSCSLKNQSEVRKLRLRKTDQLKQFKAKKLRLENSQICKMTLLDHANKLSRAVRIPERVRRAPFRAEPM